MRAGALNRRIIIERVTTTADEMNNPVETWRPYVTVWASKEDVRDSERYIGKEKGAEISTRFQIRYSNQVADLNAKDRIRFDDKIYGIVGVKEIGRRQGLEISAVVRGD